MNLVTNLNDTSAKYTQILANSHEYQDKSDNHEWQIDTKITANPHEYGDKSECYKWQIHMRMIANKHEPTFIDFL